MIVPDRQMPTGERTKVLDFGIAKLAKSEERSQIKTQTNAMLGTPFYMSPEQATGSRKVDEKTDVYSLGVILFEMLSGKPPFDGEGFGELIVKHMHEPPPSLQERAPHCPPELTQLVHRLLEKDRTKRPSMAEIVEMLDAMREHHPRPRRRLSQGLPIIRVSAHAAHGAHAAQPEPPQRPSTLGRASGQALAISPRRLIIAGAGATALLALMLVVIQSSRRPVPRPIVLQPAASPATAPGPSAPTERTPLPGPPPATPGPPPSGPSEGVHPSGTATVAGAPTQPAGSEGRTKKLGRGSGKKGRTGKTKSVRPHIEE